MTRSREEKSGNSPSKKSGLSGRLGKLSNWERVGGVLAILLFFISVYLLISILSFLFSNGADQSLLETSTKEILTNSKIKFANAGGRFGAILANMFINKGFGFASLGAVYLLIILSLKFGKIGKVSLSRNFAYTIFLIVWTSVSSAYFLSSFYEKSFIMPGGIYGFFVSQLLNAHIGKVGTFFLILVSMVVCIIIAFESAWPTIRKLITYRREKAEKQTATEDDIFNIPQAPILTEDEQALPK